MRMDDPRMAWTRCATDTVGAQQKLQIAKTILDSPTSVILVLDICNAQTSIVITCIATEAFPIAFNGLDQHPFYFGGGGRCNPREITIGM